MSSDTADALRALFDACVKQATARRLDLTRAELRAANLDGLRATGLVAGGACFARGSLRQAVLRDCDFRSADFAAVDLTAASIRLCRLDRAVLRQVRAREAKLENCSACAADLDDCDAVGASFVDTDLSRSSLRQANLRRVSASGANFRGADLTSACLVDADLSGADLRGADLRDADLTGANVSGARLEGADTRAAVGLGEREASARASEPSAGDVPAELQPLLDAVGPVVVGLLSNLGQRGALQPDSLTQLLTQARAAGYSELDPSHQATVAAVARALSGIQGNALEAVLGALGSAPVHGGPPREVVAMLERLVRELPLTEGASLEDVLAHFRSRPSRPNAVN